MNTYYIDFSGYCEISANNKKEAIEKFWELILNDKPLPANIYAVEGIEKKE